MVSNYLQSKATAGGILGQIMQNPAFQYNSEIQEDAAAGTGIFDKKDTEIRKKRNEDLALKYVREIKKLTQNREAVKQLLFQEINRENINKKLADQISLLIGTHMPLLIDAIRDRKHFKKMAVNYSLRKQFIDLIGKLEDDTQKEASFYFNRKMAQIFQKNSNQVNFNFHEMLLRYLNPQMNQKVLELEPEIDRRIYERAIQPYFAELEKAYEGEIEKKFKRRSKADTLCKKINYIDMKMHKSFLASVAHKSAAFQLLAYEYFFRKQNQVKLRAFSRLCMKYSFNPYKLSKLMRISPMVFRIRG